MLKLAALALAGLTVVAMTPRIVPDVEFPQPAPAVTAAPWSDDASRETLTAYYSPLPSTGVARFVGLGMAYHMALVYTDADGRSYGASSGPSDLASGQTPRNALSALVAAAADAPVSAFGTLVSDPRNGTPFTIDGAGDSYTHDGRGCPYPSEVVAHSRDLRSQWAVILRTYAGVGRMHLPYSPISQNSNTVAATALRRAGLDVRFSKSTPFAPGLFTRLPDVEGAQNPFSIRP